MHTTELVGRDPGSGTGLAVAVADGVITGIRHVEHAGDAWLAAGLVDLQVNGFGGFGINAEDVDAEQVAGAIRACWHTGVTTVVPTLVTGSEDRLLRGLRAVAAARATDSLLAHAIPYVHMEGPYLSPEEGARGVHAIEHIRPPDLAEFTRWQQAGEGLVGLITLSPHTPEAPSYITTIARQGVHVSIGHTHATPEQITAAVDAGASLSTHLGNGAPAVIPRHPNYVWAQLAEDRLTAGFIADGHHLPADTLTAMLRAKGLDRSFLVSDATELAGRPPGRYRTHVGGEVELSTDGRASFLGTPYLAGAASPLADGVAHLANLGRFSLGDAIRLATSSPGRFCGGRGTIRIGAPADLIRFHWAPGDTTLQIDTVLVAGLPQTSKSYPW